MYTVSARYVGWAEFEGFPDKEQIKLLKYVISALEEVPVNCQGKDTRVELKKMKKELKWFKELQYFRLLPTKTTVAAYVPLDDAVNKQTPLKGVSITQLPINVDDATTGHELQGMSTDKLIVASWLFLPNWIYVVLPRVRTLSGLVRLTLLPEYYLDKFQVPQDFRF